MADTPTPEMVERVARAICVSDFTPFATSADYWERYRPHALAVIKAMREPTDAMLGAAAPAHEEERIMHKVAYRLMIDAALSETPIPEGWPTGTGAQLVGSISSARGYAHSRAKTSLGSRSMTALSETPETGER